MAAGESIEFEWTLDNYMDSADRTQSPDIELCGRVYFLRAHPHERKPYLLLVQKAGDATTRPIRLKYIINTTPGKKKTYSDLWESGIKSTSLALPSMSDVVRSGNVLRVDVTLEGVVRAPNGQSGELVVKKRKRQGDSTSTTTAPETKRQRPLADDSAFLCTLCLDKMRDVVFKPCRHMGCCFTCAAQLEHKRCPYCNEDFTEAEQVFLP